MASQAGIRVRLLQDFYEQVLIPPAVWKEVVEEGQGRAGVREVEEAARSGWLKVMAPTNELLVRLLKRDLDKGEAEAIALVQCPMDTFTDRSW